MPILSWTSDGGDLPTIASRQNSDPIRVALELPRKTDASLPKFLAVHGHVVPD